MTTLPKRGTREYEWWSAGAHAEADARREGRSKAGLGVLSFVDALAEHHHEMDDAEIAATTFSIYALAGQPLRARMRYALWVLRDGKGRARRRPRTARKE
ncbi:hypothetical protein [Streptomyces sp. bgisy034]|uniref:hypothetical protein n=1 Tax=Streptomyces sp. bgisy034 TaxID=3413774 RepID=UPI003EBE09A7